MYKQNTCKNMKQDREEKTKFSKILPNNHRVQEMTMNEKLNMIGLIQLFMLFGLFGEIFRFILELT